MKLRYYIFLRILMVIPTVIILLTTVFFLMHIIPGDPVTIMFGDEMPNEFLDEIRHRLGLDRPMYIQYIDYMSRFFRGDLGISYRFKIPVTYKVRDVFPTTIELTIGGILLAILIGIPLGLLASLKKGGIIDHIIRLASLYLYSNPNFWLALLFQLYFGVMLRMLPISGRSPYIGYLPRVTGIMIVDSLLALDFRAFRETIRYMILPWLTVGITRVPYLSRISRAAMLNELGEDYIITARAKGLKKSIIIYKHALRNAILPIITSIGGSFAFLLGGTVIVEKIFSLPGMGSLLMEGLTGRDFNMIQGVVGIYAIIVIVVNTLVDVLYAVADPRVKF